MRTSKLVFALSFCATAVLSTAQTTPKPKPVTFDVVSIRPSKPGTMTSGWITPDGFTERGQDLWTVIMTAYFPDGIASWSNERLRGAPSWIGDQYDIDARVAPSDLADWQKHPEWPNPVLASALQVVLAQRFHLTVHRIPGTAPGQILAVGKHGIRFKAASPGEILPAGMKTLSGGVSSSEENGHTIRFHAATMDDLTWYLSLFSFPRKPIQNRTGLFGKYDFTIHRLEAITTASGANPSNDGVAWDLAPLGLDLKEIDVPLDVIVIDHIERPSEN